MIFDARRRNQLLIGGALWGVFLFSPLEAGILQPIAALLLLALFVVLPLGLLLTTTKLSAFSLPIPFKVALFLQPFAAVIAAVSFILPKGILAGTFAIAWLPVTLFVAWNGIQTARGIGFRKLMQNPAELCFVVAQLYIPIGAIWLLASRLGMEPLGFKEPIILLTAIHFHFAGFAAPILAGVTGRHLTPSHDTSSNTLLSRLYSVIAVIVMLGSAFVAVGITFSPVIEALAGTVLALGYTGLALITLRVGLQQGHWLARVFLAISALSAVVTMFAAAMYALRTFDLLPFLSIPQMVAVHGWGNAVGFVFCGLLGWGLNQKSATIM